MSGAAWDDARARAALRGLFDAAVDAADPRRVLAAHLPPKPANGRCVVVGAGKSAAVMAAALEVAWPDVELTGTRYGHAVPTARIEVIEAAHPVPDANSERGACRLLERVQGLGPDDLVLALISGGGKAPARVVTLAISDVPGDDPAVIASGPTVPDPTTFATARALLARYGIDPSPQVAARLAAGEAEETPKPGSLPPAEYRMIATPMMALRSVAAAASAVGLRPIILGDALEGEAREMGIVMAGIARSVRSHAEPLAPPCVLLSGGEGTVTIGPVAPGRGGRNTEFLLGLAVALQGAPGIWAVAGDTDGIDGTEDAAGALIAPDTIARARAAGLDPQAILAAHDSYGLFDVIGDLIRTGPTLTNVNDIRAILIA
jgi:glycerate 2-kinase